MTLGTTPPLIDYVENGVTLIHPIPFQFQLAQEIVCSRFAGGVETILVLGADYNVTGGGGLTGSVTKSNGGVAGQTFEIRRNTTRAQQTDLVAHDNFPAETVETSLDRGAMVNQEQDTTVADVKARSILVPHGETGSILPAAAARADKVAAFDLTGKMYAPNVSAQNLETLAGIAAQIVVVALNIAAVLDAPNEAAIAVAAKLAAQGFATASGNSAAAAAASAAAIVNLSAVTSCGPAPATIIFNAMKAAGLFDAFQGV